MIKDVAEPTHIHSLTALLADIEVIGLVSRVAIDALRLESVEFLAFHEEGLGSIYRAVYKSNVVVSCS